jgi:hypothetical protein
MQESSRLRPKLMLLLSLETGQETPTAEWVASVAVIVGLVAVYIGGQVLRPANQQ